MPFTLIPGRFFVVGYSPDGDSMKFQADSVKDWRKLGLKPKVKLSVQPGKQRAQLRFQAIDALETHFQPNGHEVHQPLELAQGARTRLLELAGFKGIKWGPSGREVTAVDRDGLDGYIISNEVERYGRPVAFVYRGKPETNQRDGIYLDAATVRKSINFQLAAEGWAYPTYYDGLFHDLRGVFTTAVKAARKAKKGVWKHDKTSGVTVAGMKTITNDAVILPKLFRRLASHIAKFGNVKNFKSRLAGTPERVVILSLGHSTHFDTVVEQSGNKVGLSVPPDDLMFLT